MADPKNILFVVIDQLRADCVFGELGQHVELPNLRALMADAVTFKEHYSVTNPCGPSRASLLTGQYAMNHRSVRNGTPLRHDTLNLGTELRKAGYIPKLFGYTDTSQDPRVHDAADPAMFSYEYPMASFQEEVEMRAEVSQGWQAYLKDRGYQFNGLSDLYIPQREEGELKPDGPALYAKEHSDTAYLTDKFLEHMDANSASGWCAHLTYIRPHPPLVAPAPYNRMYDPMSLPMPQRLASWEHEEAVHPFFRGTLRTSSVAKFVDGQPDLTPTDETIQTLRAIYLGLATEVDYHLGRVFDFLKERGEYHNTLIVVTADHGEMLGDHHSWGKMSVHDPAFHVPLVVRMPGNSGCAGLEVTQPTESVDVTPTILEWIARDVPNSLDGRSLLPLLRGEVPADWRDYSYSEIDFGEPTFETEWQKALGTSLSASNLAILREERFLLAEFAGEVAPILLERNSDGSKNLASEPGYEGELLRMTQKMLRHRMRNADQTLSWTSITDQGAIEAQRWKPN